MVQHKHFDTMTMKLLPDPNGEPRQPVAKAKAQKPTPDPQTQSKSPTTIATMNTKLQITKS